VLNDSMIVCYWTPLYRCAIDRRHGVSTIRAGFSSWRHPVYSTQARERIRSENHWLRL